jgi:anaerobic ribonucleoside-triphosphate reductase
MGAYLDTFITHGLSPKEVADLLGMDLNEIEDYYIAYGAKNNVASFQLCNNCYNFYDFNVKGGVKILTPCCRKDICMSCCMISTKHLEMSCPFCETTLYISQRLFNQWSKYT